MGAGVLRIGPCEFGVRSKTEKSSPNTPSLEALTEENVVCAVPVTEVHIKFIVVYIELVLCIETE